MRLAAYVLLGLVILVAGCVGLPGDLFGRDVVNVRSSIIRNGEKDAVVINSVDTLPRGLALPDQEVKLFMTIENRDSTKIAKNVFLDLFNPSIFKCNDKVNVDEKVRDVCITENSMYSRVEANDLLPGQQEQVVFNLKAPSEHEIAGIKQDAKLDYKLSYDFYSSFSYMVPVVDIDEIVRQQQANEKIVLQTSKSYSSGPIQIDAELQGGGPYMLDGQATAIFFKIKNIGSGVLNGSQIGWSVSAGDIANDIFSQPINLLIQAILPNEMPMFHGIIIKFPSEPDMEIVSYQTELFRCEKPINRCVSLKPIPVFKDESRLSMRFGIKSTLPEGTPYRTYPIVAIVGYTYELRNSASLSVNSANNI